MITNFEDITEDLNPRDLQLLSTIIDGFKLHVGKDKAIKAPMIVSRLRMKNIPFSEVKLRKFANYIRSHSLLPLIATPDGYYLSDDQEDINKQIRSLEERARSIQQSADGLKHFIK